MKKIITFIKNLQFIFKPSYWIMDDNYDEAWDKKFQELADQHDFVPDNDGCEKEFGNKTYTALIGNYRVWVSNYPFAFFSLCGKADKSYESLSVRPSRLTIAKYYKKLVNDLAKRNCKHR